MLLLSRDKDGFFVNLGNYVGCEGAEQLITTLEHLWTKV
jgi:hypothetical protein